MATSIIDFKIIPVYMQNLIIDGFEMKFQEVVYYRENEKSVWVKCRLSIFLKEDEYHIFSEILMDEFFDTEDCPEKYTQYHIHGKLHSMDVKELLDALLVPSMGHFVKHALPESKINAMKFSDFIIKLCDKIGCSILVL